MSLVEWTLGLTWKRFFATKAAMHEVRGHEPRLLQAPCWKPLLTAKYAATKAITARPLVARPLRRGLWACREGICCKALTQGTCNKGCDKRLTARPFASRLTTHCCNPFYFSLKILIFSCFRFSWYNTNAQM